MGNEAYSRFFHYISLYLPTKGDIIYHKTQAQPAFGNKTISGGTHGRHPAALLPQDRRAAQLHPRGAGAVYHPPVPAAGHRRDGGRAGAAALCQYPQQALPDRVRRVSGSVRRGGRARL